VASWLGGVGDLDRMPQDLVERQGPPPQPLRERLPFEILHHPEADLGIRRRRSAGRRRYRSRAPDVVQHTDVRMTQCRDGSCFPLEALTQVGLIGHLGRNDFDGDGAIEPHVARAIDLAHPAASDRGVYLVGPETSARREGHRGDDRVGPTRRCTRRIVVERTPSAARSQTGCPQNRGWMLQNQTVDILMTPLLDPGAYDTRAH
jgi:hypothetical protein